MADYNDRWNDRSQERFGDRTGRGGSGSRFGRGDDMDDRGPERGGEGRSFAASGGADPYGGYREPDYRQPGGRRYGHGHPDQGGDDQSRSDQSRSDQSRSDRPRIDAGDYGDDGYDTDRGANREASEHMMHRPDYGDRSGSRYPSREFGEPGGSRTQYAGPDRSDPGGAYRGGSYRSGYGGGSHSGQSYRDGQYGQGYSSDARYGGASERDRDRGMGGQRGGSPGSSEGERGWWDRTRDEVSSWFGDDQAEQRRRMDETGMTAGAGIGAMMGGHRGKGPKNYTRSDDRIREDVNQHLTDDHEIDATHVEVEVKGGEVTLNGTVNRREDKRRAEDLAEKAPGVKHVQNNLRVQDQSPEASHGQSGGQPQAPSGRAGKSGMTPGSAPASGTQSTLATGGATASTGSGATGPGSTGSGSTGSGSTGSGSVRSAKTDDAAKI